MRAAWLQGALYGAKALATGTGPLLFAAMFAAFTKTDSPLPYFPGVQCPVSSASAVSERCPPGCWCRHVHRVHHLS